MGRIQKGPVRGISFKLQEEERERKDNYVPDESALKLSEIEVDSDTMAMLKSMNFAKLSGVRAQREYAHDGERRERRPRAN